jgi:hypothetical protein
VVIVVMRPLHVDPVFPKGVAFALVVRLAVGLPFKVIAQSTWDQRAQADDETGPQVLLETATLRGGRIVADLEGGGLAELTMNPALQDCFRRTRRVH